MELLDLSVVDKFNTIGGAFVVLATYFFGEHWMLFAAFLVLNIMDYVTGVIKSRISHTESSSAGLKGIIKKFSYWLMIMLSFGLSPILNEIGTVMDVDLSMLSPIFGWYILAVLAVNEVRSILENLVESGVNVPSVLVKGMAVLDKVVKAQEKLIVGIDGDLDIDKSADASEKYKVDIKTPMEELETKTTVTLKIHTVGDEED